MTTRPGQLPPAPHCSCSHGARGWSGRRRAFLLRSLLVMSPHPVLITSDPLSGAVPSPMSSLFAVFLTPLPQFGDSTLSPWLQSYSRLSKQLHGLPLAPLAFSKPSISVSLKGTF